MKEVRYQHWAVPHLYCVAGPYPSASISPDGPPTAPRAKQQSTSKLLPDVKRQHCSPLDDFGALFAPLAEAGIRLASHHTSHSTPRQDGLALIRVRSAPPFQLTPTRNFYARIASARAPLERARGAARELALFAAGCILAEMIAEKRLPPDIAMRLLESDCQTNGLWKELGKERCRRTIARAFRHVEEKILSAT